VKLSNNNLPLFALVCGFEHSGTTLVSEILRQYPQLDSGFEGGFLLNNEAKKFLTTEPFYTNCKKGWGLSDQDLRYICDVNSWPELYFRLRERSTVIEDKNIWLFDKTPRYMSALSDILERVPGVPCVVIVKDFRAVFWSSYKRTKMPLDKWYNKIFKRTMNHTLSYARSWKKALEKGLGDRILLIRYEELCLNQETETRKIFDFMDLEFHEEYLVLNNAKYKNVYGNKISSQYLKEYQGNLPEEICEEILALTSEYSDWVWEKSENSTIKTIIHSQTSLLDKSQKSNNLVKIDMDKVQDVKNTKQNSFVQDSDNYINKILEIGISRSTLRQLFSIANKYDNVCLVGFNDYSKHLINLCGSKIRLIIDQNIEHFGITFRNIAVSNNLEEARDCSAFVITDYTLLPKYLADITLDVSYKRQPILYANSYGDYPARFYQPLIHDSLYKSVLASGENSPPTMMKQEKLLFLLELLQSCLKLDGDVLEVGVWQGGSTWYILQTLKLLDDLRRVQAYDFFEQLAADNIEGIMCLEEIKRRMSFYPYIEFVDGDLRETIQSVEKHTFCFIHYDMGFQQKILDIIFDRLQVGGILLLDNYGHIRANPGLFDDFFRVKGTYVARVPFSEQGWVIKR
jgi:hypothetical protein